MPSKYYELGVDVEKRGIEVFSEILENLFPEAFCVVSRNPHHRKEGIVLHTDSAGSKPVQAYLQWKETDDPSSFEGLAQDALAMNIDDIICVGATPVSFVDYVALNSKKVGKETLLKALSRGFKGCLKTLGEYGLQISFSGGETADLPDQMRTLDVSVTALGYVDLSKVISGSGIEPGDLIVGLRSGGKTSYERRENSGLMCNGVTLARHCLMRKEYQDRYPEIAETEGRGYYGRFRIEDYLDELGMTVGEALLSPTRLYAPIVMKLLEEHGEGIHGLIHNTGGGQTKCLRLGRNIHYIKDRLTQPDPIFRLIKEESGEEWRDMYRDYNMGIGFEVIAAEGVCDDVIGICESFKLEAEVIGRCEKSIKGNKLTIVSPYGKFTYSQK